MGNKTSIRLNFLLQVGNIYVQLVANPRGKT